MKWSWKLTRLAGIDVYVHATFFILIAWIGLGYWQAEGSVAAVTRGIGFILALFGCVVLHELGHALTARRYGIRTRHITLLPEPPRVYRRLHFLRGLEYEQSKSIFPRGQGTGSTDGFGARSGVQLSMVSDVFNRGKDWVYAGDLTQMGASSRV